MQLAYNQYWKLRYRPGTSILEEDWDNLLLLDACRYDEFCRLDLFDNATIDSRITLGSRTPEYLERTFDDVKLHDTVYVTANPQVLKFQSESDLESPIFYNTISLLDEWDEDAQTIRPEEVTQAALRADREYPNKRLIIHFLQPHAPFLGPTAKKIQDRTGKTVGGVDPGREYTNIQPQNINSSSYMDVLEMGISPEEIRTAYRETLQLVLEECNLLRGTLSGKTALTSDHGELLGERVHPFGDPRWEHPPKVRTSELCIVPWVEFEATDRKSVIEESPKQFPEENDETVESRLQALGYR